MDRLFRENGVHIYLLDENQPNDLYKLPKELHVGREHTDKGQTGVMLRPIEGVIKLDKVVRDNKIDENLRQLCEDVYWLLAYNLHKEHIFVVAKYKYSIPPSRKRETQKSILEDSGASGESNLNNTNRI